MRMIAIYSFILALARGELVANLEGQAQELKGSNATKDDVCAGRSSSCSVLLDIPKACAGATSACPIAFYFHGHGGSNRGFPHQSYVHEYNFIGVYPQGESYAGRPGWNDGSMDGLKCKWNDFSCTLDPNDGLFTAGIVSSLQELGATGRVYMYGTSNGANEVQILASNSGTALPVVGIAARSGQLMSHPLQSGPNPFNYNQPCAGDQPCSGGAKIAQLSMHGTADNTIRYYGGPRFGSPVFIMDDERHSDGIWATQNGCAGSLQNTTVPAVSVTGETTTAAHSVWQGCPATAPVELYAVFGAPHGAARSLDGKDSMITVMDFFTKVEKAHGGPSPAPTPPSPTPPSPAPTPPPGPPPSPDTPPAACQQCLKSKCLSSRGGAACTACLEQYRNACASSCKPFPFQKAEKWFCGSVASLLV